MEKQTKADRQKPLLVAALATIAFLFAHPAEAAAQTQQRSYKPGDRVEMDGGEVYVIIRCDGEGEWDECEYQAYFNNRASGRPNRMAIRSLRASEERLRLARERAGKSGGGAGNANDSTLSRTPSSAPQRTSAPRAPREDERTPPGGTAAGLDGTWKVGDKLEVNDRAFWYPAEIIAVQRNMYRIHFEGYPSSDDKWVDASRMRPVGGYRVSAQCSYAPPGAAFTGGSRFSEALAKRKIYDEYN